MIAWLTLVVSLVITGDLVMDLAFEEAILDTAADTSSIPEELDNAAEHILMPSQKADRSIALAWLIGTSAAVHAVLIATCLPSATTDRAGPTHERPPRSSPLPLLLPLRI
ncbi:MAG: hypothetical protein OJF47_003634 [Nitrospira sp.]|jgi:hypothetical protein|nr:MAG: hypothetical protein OJF47_003634 [Nitrospira sp.]